MKIRNQIATFLFSALLVPAGSFAQEVSNSNLQVDQNSDQQNESPAREESNSNSPAVQNSDQQDDLINYAPASETLAKKINPSELTESKKIEQLDFALAMATIALRRGNIAEAKQHVEYGLSVASDNDQLWYLNGLILSATGSWEKAVESFNKSLELNSNQDLSFEIGNAYWQLKQYDNAEKSLANCQTPRCNMIRGLIASDQNDYQSAASYFDKSADASSDDSDNLLPANYYSANAKLIMGEFKAARKTLDESRTLAKKEGLPWNILYAGMKRNLQLFNFYGALGVHFDSNIARFSDITLEQMKANGESNLADLDFSIKLAGNFRYFFTPKIRMNLNIGFNQLLYLLEGPDTRKYNMTNGYGGLALAFGWGPRPTLNFVDISYNISSVWVLGEAHKKDIGLDFFALSQAIGPSVNLNFGKGNLNAGYRLLINKYDDAAFLPGLTNNHDRDEFSNRLHVIYKHQVLSCLNLGGSLNGGYANAQSDAFDRGFFGANFNLEWQPSYRGSLGLNLGYGLADYNKHNLDRFDNQLDIAVNLGNLLNTFMNLGIDIMYTHRWSTVDIYSYDRILIGLNIAFTL